MFCFALSTELSQLDVTLDVAPIARGKIPFEEAPSDTDKACAVRRYFQQLASSCLTLSLDGQAESSMSQGKEMNEIANAVLT